MSFLTILETLLLGPLKLLFEIVFSIANIYIGSPGLAIVALSLTMNLLLLPLYRRTDAMQEEARDVEAKLHDGVVHIKKTFSGDERMMILQTYYRQNHYSPLSALNGSLSLLLEIPFFIAAYNFLSNLELLSGVSFGPIPDLGAPDGLLVIGGITVNLLPILMTAINFLASALYLKGYPTKTKVQLYAMALFFLVFLYSSPSGLLFYWTLNNLFSLIKTIFYKLKNPRKILGILMASVGVLLLYFALFLYQSPSLKRKLLFAGIGVALMLPLFLPAIIRKLPLHKNANPGSYNKKLFLLGSVFLTVLTGLLIPSTFIAASPQEFVDPSNFQNPLWYIVSATVLAAGTFLVWMQVFYYLADSKGKAAFDKLVWIASGVMLVNYMFFGTDLGVLSSTLQYERFPVFTLPQQLVNLLVLTAIAATMYWIAVKWQRAAAPVLLTAVIALGGMSLLNIFTINKSLDAMYITAQEDAEKVEGAPLFRLSKNGKNVVVIMLDRAMGEYVPYLLNEKPELREQFDGFTYYSNTISFGGHTNFGAPALMGGYEYTPVEMNKRSTEPLVEKHNEALKVMPVLFSENGFETTVCDPPLANYQWIPDLSIYDDYPSIRSYNTNGLFGDGADKEAIFENTRRNFFCFSLMKSLPLSVHNTIYNNGLYHHLSTTQVISSLSTANGLSPKFMDAYNVLVNLPNITDVSSTGENTFLFLGNDATHQGTLLQTPGYVPSTTVDNTAYDAAHTERFTVNGRTLKCDDPFTMMHYHSNMAALLQLGKWFDYLRENGVYDNTRIILVADHGHNLRHLDDLVVNKYDLEYYYPLLMVKDFDSTGFITSDTFMTNADVPVLALEGLIENPVNPFTGNPINSGEKTAHDQFITMSEDHEVKSRSDNTFLPSTWASVKDNIWDSSNWTFYDDTERVLTEHAVHGN